MSEKSYNGWTASKDPTALGAVTFEVPTVVGRKFTTVKVAAPIFKYMIRRWHAEVDPITGGVMDDWSYCYRKARKANALSCHASATAVDLDAAQFPMGRQNMTKKQVDKVTAIVAACRNQVKWGGTYRMPLTDQMHLELMVGTNPDSVRKAIIAMFLYEDGRQMHPTDVDPSADPRRIALLKKALATVGLYPKRPVYNGKWNTKLGAAWSLWRTRRPKDTVQARIDSLGSLSGLF